MVGYRFNTVGVSDAISMGTDGMSFSLQSRDLIADSVETVMGAQVRAKSGQFFIYFSHILLISYPVCSFHMQLTGLSLGCCIAIVIEFCAYAYIGLQCVDI
jgi:hypothetical protein